MEEEIERELKKVYNEKIKIIVLKDSDGIYRILIKINTRYYKNHFLYRYDNHIEFAENIAKIENYIDNIFILPFYKRG